jgi:hypothetical protein
VCRHDEMGKQGLRGRLTRKGCKLRDDAVWADVRQQLQLGGARCLGAFVRQVHNLALRRAVNRAVRLVNEALQVLGMPVVAPRLLLVAVHALLHYRPLAIVGHEEAVEVEIEAVLHGGGCLLWRPGGSRV